MIEQLCAPALIYVCFSLTQIVIDMFKGLYNTAFFKFWVMMIFTMSSNVRCNLGLGVISWLLVFVPFISMTTITAILLVSFGLDPRTGAVKVGNGGGRRRRRKRHGSGAQTRSGDSDGSDSDSDGSDSDGGSGGGGGSRGGSGRGRSRGRGGGKSGGSKHGCRAMGCTEWDGSPDGNCVDHFDPKTGKCTKQCYYGCAPGTGSCNYDSDCKPKCPVKKKMPCAGKKEKPPAHGTKAETFIANMMSTTRLG
jgi:hypothetical protein